jgi:3-hydroxybutyryl-CoA dehydratase
MKSSFTHTFTESDVAVFSKMIGDSNPLHMDKEFAKSSRFGKRVVFGMQVASLLSTLAGMHLPGKMSLILSVDTQFKSPVFIGDELVVDGTIDQKVDFGQMIVMSASITKKTGEVAMVAKMRVQVQK